MPKLDTLSICDFDHFQRRKIQNCEATSWMWLAKLEVIMLLLLIVDDDATDRENVRRSLYSLQAQIHEADTCESCLKKINEFIFKRQKCSRMW